MKRTFKNFMLAALFLVPFALRAEAKEAPKDTEIFTKIIATKDAIILRKKNPDDKVDQDFLDKLYLQIQECMLVIESSKMSADKDKACMDAVVYFSAYYTHMNGDIIAPIVVKFTNKKTEIKKLFEARLKEAKKSKLWSNDIRDLEDSLDWAAKGKGNG